VSTGSLFVSGQTGPVELLDAGEVFDSPSFFLNLASGPRFQFQADGTINRITAYGSMLASDPLPDLFPTAMMLSPDFASEWIHTSTGFLQFNVVPTAQNTATVQFSDGSSRTFGSNVLPDNSGSPIFFGDVSFLPLFDAELRVSGSVLVSGSFPGPVTLLDIATLQPFGPTDFGYTDGYFRRFVVRDGHSFEETIHGLEPLQQTTPVPEPSSLLLLSIGAAGLLAQARRLKKQQVK
jgi:hypothetical protein